MQCRPKSATAAYTHTVEGFVVVHVLNKTYSRSSVFRVYVKRQDLDADHALLAKPRRICKCQPDYYTTATSWPTGFGAV